MKKVFILIVLILAIAAGGWYVWKQEKQQADPLKLTLYGNIDIREAQLAFNGSEHIDKILVEEGEHVKKGQLLATLHTETLKANIEQIKAQIDAQKQLVNKLIAGARPDEIERARVQLKAAQIKAKSASDTEHRLTGMFKRKLISDEDVENAKMLADTAKYEMQASQLTLNLLKEGSRKEDIASAEAQLAALQASLKLANVSLKNASLYAPDDGIIRNRILQPGEMAFPQSPVFTLALVNPVWVRTYLPETDLGKIALGSIAEIHTDSYPNKTYKGWVGFISPTAEFTPKNVQTPELRTRLVYSARVFACNPQNELRLGMPATVSIKLGQTGTPGAEHQCK